MPHQYTSESLNEAARRGRRAMLTYRAVVGYGHTNPDWQTWATDLIADILHGLNSRVELDAINFRHPPGSIAATGTEAIMRRAIRTYTTDFEEE